MKDRVYSHISHLVTMESALKKRGRSISYKDLSIISDAAVVVTGSPILEVAWVGPQKALPLEYGRLPHVDLGGRMVLPAFIDSHTHLVFAGERSHELEMRLAGMSYQQIAEGGGGIIRSMRSTRLASFEELY